MKTPEPIRARPAGGAVAPPAQGDLDRRNLHRSEGEAHARERTAELTTMIEWLRAEEAAHEAAQAEARRRNEQLARFEAALLRLVTLREENLDAMLREVTEVVAHTLEVERAAVWLFDPQHSELRCRDKYRRSDDVHEHGLVLRAADCPRYIAALEKRLTIAAADVSADDRTAEICRTFLGAANIRALLAAPIRAGSGVVGVLSHGETRGPRVWQQEEQDFATAVAGIVALAVEAETRRRTEAQLHALTAHLETVREEERAGLARELHDVLGQTLTAIRMDAGWIERALTGPPEKLAARGPERVASMKELIDDAIRTVQRISSDLRPGALQELGLVAALQWQAAEFEKRSGLAVRFTSPETVPLDNDRIGVTLYRALQETLTNVARHAEATEVEVALTAECARLVLEVRDNGRGIPAEAAVEPSSLGLIGMRERAMGLGGEVTFAGTPGAGTTVRVVIPTSGARE